MTYKQLAETILTWSEEQQCADVTIVDFENATAYAAGLSFVEDDETGELDDFGLDNNHPFLYSRKSK